jgi:hypothetical protein
LIAGKLPRVELLEATEVVSVLFMNEGEHLISLGIQSMCRKSISMPMLPWAAGAASITELLSKILRHKNNTV